MKPAPTYSYNLLTCLPLPKRARASGERAGGGPPSIASSPFPNQILECLQVGGCVGVHAVGNVGELMIPVCDVTFAVLVKPLITIIMNYKKLGTVDNTIFIVCTKKNEGSGFAK